jgi:hypothetical protein
LVARLLALWAAAAEATAGDQNFQKHLTRGVRELKPPAHLKNAGDPRSLYQEARILLLEEFRHNDLRNRTIDEQAPQVGDGGTTDTMVQTSLLVETQPLALNKVRRTSLPTSILDVAAVLLGVFSWSLWLYAHRAPTIVLFLTTLALWLITLKLCLDLFGLAFSAHSTYRFHSHVFWVEFEGNCQKTTVAIGGALGPISSQREGFSSDLRLKLLGASLITECHPAGRFLFFRRGETDSLHAPRHIISAPKDREFVKRFDEVRARLVGFRDESNKPPTPEANEELRRRLAQSPQSPLGRSEIATDDVGPNLPRIVPPQRLPAPDPPSPREESDTYARPGNADWEDVTLPELETTDEDGDVEFDPDDWKL